MKIKPRLLFLAACAFSIHATAQYIPAVTKTSFNKFVEDDDIQWAAYANDTARFQVLTDRLIEQHILNKITGFLPVENGVAAEDSMQRRDAADIARMFGGDPRPAPMYDSAGTMLPDSSSDNSFAASLLTEFKNTVVEFYQIFFIEKNRLRSYVTRAALRKEIISPSGTDLGLVEYVSFCINKKYKNTSSKKDKLIHLGEVKRDWYTDSLPEFNKLKLQYGRDLIASLAPSILAGKLQVRAVNSDREISVDQLISGEYPAADQIDVPVYDSTGNYISSKKVNGAINFFNFKKAVITEDFYYDETKNIIICKIPELVLFKYGAGSGTELLPALRLVF